MHIDFYLPLPFDSWADLLKTTVNWAFGLFWGWMIWGKGDDE